MLTNIFNAFTHRPNSDQTAMSKPNHPPHFSSQVHRERVLAQLRSKDTGLERYIYLNGLKDREPHLFYELLLANMMVSTASTYLEFKLR